MSKRSLSPAILPPSKRLHTTRITKPPPLQPLRFDNCLYDELILYIFSYLSWVDLCISQPTNRNWARLTADNELWRDLYLRTYGRTRLRGSKGFICRADGREVKQLPGRAKSDQLKDWKWMFRISSNWRKGEFLGIQFFRCFCFAFCNYLFFQVAVWRNCLPQVYLYISRNSRISFWQVPWLLLLLLRLHRILR